MKILRGCLPVKMCQVRNLMETFFTRETKVSGMVNLN